MTGQILEKILEDNFTLSELRHRIHVLRFYLNKRLFGNDTTEFDSQVRVEAGWFYKLGEPFFNQFNKANLSQIFDALEAEVSNLPVLTIYFAFEPGRDELHRIGDFLRKNFGPKFIFDAKFDPTLIAGCAFVWKGGYKDYSLRARVAENRQQILETIKGGLR